MLFMLKNKGEEQEHPEGLQEAEREQQREEESAGGLAETSGLNLLAYKRLIVLLTPPKATRVVRADGISLQSASDDLRIFPWSSHGIRITPCGFPVPAGVSEGFGRAAALDGGEVPGGRRRVVPRPHQHPPKAEET